MLHRIHLAGPLRATINALIAAVNRLDKSFSPADTLSKLRTYKFTLKDSIYILHLLSALFWLTLMQVPPFPYKLAIPILYAIALFIPFTSQFFLPATPVFSWVLMFYSNQFLSADHRPAVHVVLLPTLESVLYGANISDILTRFTHPILDIIAWLPYGVIHYTFPLVLAALLWLFRPPALPVFAQAFGYQNCIGVFTQIVLPCAAPWYEIIYGLTPAAYGTPGSAGGLGRIDELFGGEGYKRTFASSPLVFGAFPSLHAAWVTLEALFLSAMWPACAKWAWGYAAVLYWSTMYLSHHYLIDVVGGACLATACFYFFVDEELRHGNANGATDKYERYDLESRRGGFGVGLEEFASDSTLSDEEGTPIAYRSPNPANAQGKGRGRGHRHTASIASLIRADERAGEEGWSPITGGGFVFPPEGRR